MALDMSQIEGLNDDQIKQTLIEYSVALDNANALALANATARDNALKTTMDLNEQIDIMKTEIENLNTKLKENKNSKNKNNTNELNEKINTLEKLLEERDNTISHLKQKQNVIKEQPKTNNGIIHTYNILGYDNRTGRAINGGDQYTKASVLVKYHNNVFIWEVISPELGLNISKTLELNEEQSEKLKITIKEKGSFTTIKEFLEIPDTVEEKFKDDIRLLR